MTKKAAKKKERSPAHKENDGIWDTLSAMYSEPVTKNDKSLRGEQVKGFRQHKATPEEMAEPLILLNSEASRFISGINLFVDFGYTGQVFCGQRPGLLIQ